MSGGVVNQPAFVDMPRPQRRVIVSGGTDLSVADGGTGRSSHTDGGLLIGKGVGPIENTGEMANGEMVVGDGTTNPVLESGATLRTSIGVGTGNSPQFTGIELGAASDTTLTRASAGEMNIEGQRVHRLGGTDITVADGGTGVPTHTDGSLLIGKGASAVENTGVLADGEIVMGDGATNPVLAPYRSPNLVINGAMRQAFAPAATTITASQYGPVNRWEWIDTGTTAGAVTITQVTDVPTVAEAGTRFMNSLKIDCTTAEDLAGANAALFLSHKIEAQNCTLFGHGATGALAARLSFWIKSTKTGIFCVNVDRDDASEKFTTEFTINTTDTWEFKTVTVPGDTNGTIIANDNGIGLALQFMMSVGGDGDTATANAWNASGATELATANQVNMLDNTANNILITGVMYRLGSVNTPFDHHGIREELLDCKRYYEEFGSGITSERFGLGMNLSTTGGQATIYYTEKRVSPTITISSAGDFDVRQNDGTAELVTVLATAGASGLNMGTLDYTVSANLIAGEVTQLLEGSGAAGAARVKVDAEL